LQYLDKFYVASRGVVDALTWHHYFMAGASATTEDFLNPKWVDKAYKKFFTFV
jgi:hypothetical protein